MTEHRDGQRGGGVVVVVSERCQCRVAVKAGVTAVKNSGVGVK